MRLMHGVLDPTACPLTVPLRAPCPKLGYSAQKFSSCVVSRASVALKHRLSSGNFGEVWLATYRGVDVAVKCALATTPQQEIVEEAEVMHQLHHPRLVRFLGVCCEPSTEPIMIITEFMPKGALDGYLKEKRPCYEDLLDIIFQVSRITTILCDTRLNLFKIHSQFTSLLLSGTVSTSPKDASNQLLCLCCHRKRILCRHW